MEKNFGIVGGSLSHLQLSSAHQLTPYDSNDAKTNDDLLKHGWMNGRLSAPRPQQPRAQKDSCMQLINPNQSIFTNDRQTDRQTAAPLHPWHFHEFPFFPNQSINQSISCTHAQHASISAISINYSNQITQIKYIYQPALAVLVFLPIVYMHL